MSTDNFRGKFRRWRRLRPFWGGLFLILSAAEMFLSSNMELDGMQVHLGPQGFLSYVLPLVLLLCGLLSWFTPPQRLFYGIVALLAALYSFVGLNLGGFFVGMLLGIIGGGLVIAWGPPQPRPAAENVTAPPSDGPDNEAPQDLDETRTIATSGHDDRPPYDRQVRPSAQETAIVPGFPQHAAPRKGLGKNPKAMVLALVPLAATAAVFVAGSNQPASAEECPKGLPSRSAPASKVPAAKAPAAKTSAPKAKTSTKPAPKSTGTTSPSGKTAATPSASSSAAPAEDEGGNPILEGIENFFDGVGNLLGIDGTETPSPSASPSPSESAPGEQPEPSAPASSGEPPASQAPSASASAPATSASAKPSPSDTEIPCLGARVFGKIASAEDIPLVSGKPGVMKVDSLTMYNSTYDGVVDMPVAGGTSFKALKFSMDKAVNKPFNLTIDEAGKSTTVITSDELTTTGTVRFYTSEFKGNLFGLIPVTFTPDSPPPLTLPVLWFTEVTIQLAYVRSDVLTGDPLKVQEQLPG